MCSLFSLQFSFHSQLNVSNASSPRCCLHTLGKICWDELYFFWSGATQLVWEISVIGLKNRLIILANPLTKWLYYWYDFILRSQFVLLKIAGLFRFSPHAAEIGLPSQFSGRGAMRLVIQLYTFLRHENMLFQQYRSLQWPRTCCCCWSSVGKELHGRTIVRALSEYGHHHTLSLQFLHLQSASDGMYFS